MKKLLIILLLLCPSLVWAACPTEAIYNTATPFTFSFEKRDGTGEDTTNTANKRVAFSYWNGSAMRWWNATDWTSTTEQLLTMTQSTGSQYYYILTPSSTVSGKVVSVRYDETNDVDVTATCEVYIQPEVRWVQADERGTDSAATASALATAQTDLDTLTGADGVTLATSQPHYAPATAAALATAQADLDNPSQYKADVTNLDVAVSTRSSHSAADVWTTAIEGSYTAQQMLCMLAAVNFGKSSGMGTTTVTFRNLGDTVNRITGTMDSNSNRTAVTLTLTGCP